MNGVSNHFLCATGPGVPLENGEINQITLGLLDRQRIRNAIPAGSLRPNTQYPAILNLYKWAKKKLCCRTLLNKRCKTTQ